MISSRTKKRAADLAHAVDGKAIEWEMRHHFSPDVLLNGTPVGMHPKMDDSPWDQKYLRSGMVVFDTVYNPENTMLIKHAKRAKCRYVTGVDMFVRQGAYQFKLFTGREAPHQLMRQNIKDATNPVQVH